MHKTTDCQKTKSKKLQAFLQTAAVSSNQGTNRNTTNIVQDRVTPKRNKSRQRKGSRETAIDGQQSLISRRISQQSPNKRSQHEATHQNSTKARKQMTPIIQSVDKPPAQPYSHGKSKKDVQKESLGTVECDNAYLFYKTSGSYQGTTTNNVFKENVQDDYNEGQKTSDEIHMKSHRVHQKNEGQIGLVQYNQDQKQYRHRSTSNKKKKTGLQGQTTQSAQVIGAQVNINSVNNTEKQKKEYNSTNKRKKSTTRRKSTKRQQQQTQTVNAEIGQRGRSPHQSAPTTTQKTGAQNQDRHISPQSTGHIYSAFRMRAFKPKKTAKDKIEQTSEVQFKQATIDRSNQINVVFLNTQDKARTKNKQQLHQSASVGNSICSQKTQQTNKDGKQPKENATANKQKTMIQNIQMRTSPVLGKQTRRGMGGTLKQQQANKGQEKYDQSHNQDEAIESQDQLNQEKVENNQKTQVISVSKSHNNNTKKVKQETYKKGSQNDRKKHGTRNISDNQSKKVDLLKASQLTDIRIEKLQPHQVQDSTFIPSQSSSSAISQKKQNVTEKQKKTTISTTRSISSDECLVRTNEKNKKHSKAQDQDSGCYQRQELKDRGSSPKIVLSLRQLEKLLFSTQPELIQNSQHVSSQAKKKIIVNSLKQLQHSDSNAKRQTRHKNFAATSYDTSQNTQKLNVNHQKRKNTAQAKTVSKTFKNVEPHLVTLQPATLQVFNTISEPSSIQDTVTPNHIISQNSSMPKFNSIHDSIKMRTRSLEQREEDSRLLNQNLLKTTTKRIQEKITRQPQNLLTLVQGQKMRAQKMAAQAQHPIAVKRITVKDSQKQTPNKKARDKNDLALAISQHEQEALSQGVTNQLSQNKNLDDSVKPGQQQQQTKGSRNSEIQQNASSIRLQSLIYAQLEQRQPNNNNNSQQLNNSSGQASSIKNSQKQQDKTAKVDKQNQNAQKSESALHSQKEKEYLNNKSQTALEPQGSQSQDKRQEKTDTDNIIGLIDSIEDKHKDAEVNPNIVNLTPDLKQPTMSNLALRQVLPKRKSSPKSKIIEQDSPRREVVRNQSAPFMQFEVEACSSSSRQSIQRHEKSFINRVTKTGQTEERKDDKSNHSVSSFKQPSLRQITSSHTSRSNKNRLQRQDSAAEFRPSQDPNASITLSRILLETSMQQSERGVNGNTQQFTYGGIRSNDMQLAKPFNSQTGFNPQLPQMNMIRFQRLASENLTNHESQPCRASQQSMNTGGLKSDVNDSIQGLQKEDSNEQLRSIPRSLTNPDKYGNINQNLKRQSPPQNFIADEVWPNSSSYRKRTSSLTSLSNSTPASRTLGQLQLQSISSNANLPSSPQQQMKQKLQTDGRTSQTAFEDPFVRSQNLEQNLSDNNQDEKLTPEKTIEEPHVQDQGLQTFQTHKIKNSSSDFSKSMSKLAYCSSPHGNLEIQDTDAIVSRGTSSPDRRRSPLKSLLSNQTLKSASRSIIQPIQVEEDLIQLDNTLTLLASQKKQDLAPTTQQIKLQATESQSTTQQCQTQRRNLLLSPNNICQGKCARKDSFHSQAQLACLKIVSNQAIKVLHGLYTTGQFIILLMIKLCCYQKIRRQEVSVKCSRKVSTITTKTRALSRYRIILQVILHSIFSTQTKKPGFCLLQLNLEFLTKKQEQKKYSLMKPAILYLQTPSSQIILLSFFFRWRFIQILVKNKHSLALKVENFQVKSIRSITLIHRRLLLTPVGSDEQILISCWQQNAATGSQFRLSTGACFQYGRVEEKNEIF